MNLQDFLNLCGKFSSKREEALKKYRNPIDLQ